MRARSSRTLLLCALLYAIFAWLAPSTAYAWTPPSPSGAVTDTSGRLSAADDAKLEANVAAYRARTGHELGVFVAGSLDGQTVEDVAYQTFNTWGVGRKGHDDGVLLVIAPNERKVRIETGKGIGDRITDIAASHILRERVIPELKRDRVADAVLAGLEGIEAEIDGNGTQAWPSAPSRTTDRDGLEGLFLAIGAGVLFLVLMVGLVFTAVRSGRRGSSSSSSGSSSSDSSSSSWSDSGGSSGSSDFGGGSSGGGGASDSY